MRTVKAILLLNALLFTAFGCKKDEDPGLRVICVEPGISCVPVKYVGTSCQDLIQFVDPRDQEVFKTHTDSISTIWLGYRDNPEVIPHTMGVVPLPDSVKDGQVFYMVLQSMDTSNIHPAHCMSASFVLKYASLSKTPCAPGTQVKF